MMLLETWDGSKLFARYSCSAKLNASNSGKAAKIDRLTARRGTIAKTVEKAKLDASCIVLAFRERLKATTIALCQGRSVVLNEVEVMSVNMP
jgi:predicted AAA+ superfamily ATPase